MDAQVKMDRMTTESTVTLNEDDIRALAAMSQDDLFLLAGIAYKDGARLKITPVHDGLATSPATGEVRQEEDDTCVCGHFQSEHRSVNGFGEGEGVFNCGVDDCVCEDFESAPLPDPASRWSRPPIGSRGDIVGIRMVGGRTEYLMHNEALCDPYYTADALLGPASNAAEPDFEEWWAQYLLNREINPFPDKAMLWNAKQAAWSAWHSKPAAPSTSVGPPQAQEFVKECMYCGGSPDHKHGQGHACGDCCGAHGAMSTDTEDYDFVERMRVCSFNRLAQLLETRAALDAATKERDEFERKGKDLCQAYGNSLMNTGL